MKILDAIQNICILVIIACFAIALYGHSLHDDSDHPNGTRSGMTPKTDHKTGCQYLQSPFGFALVPRMGANGKQLGCKD